MPFFDLHCHPSFKSGLLNDDVASCPNPVDAVDIKLNVPFSECVEQLVGNSLDSQASFGQIPGGSLVVASFLAFERVYAFVDDLKKIKNLGTHILENMQNQVKDYHHILIDRDIAHFQSFIKNQANRRHYQLLTSITEYPANPDPNTVYVVASIEGGHNFYTRKDLVEQEKNPQEIIDALITWKKNSKDHPDKFPRLFYITMTHHGQNVLANHAWAIPIRFAANKVDVGTFDPTGNGMSAFGETFLKVALRETPTENRILVDVKHLSLASRKRVYEIFQADPTLTDVPLIATHMGVAGCSWDTPPIAKGGIRQPGDRPKNTIVKYKPIGGFLREKSPGELVNIPFNPWSINLYNEDIVQIMRTRGLIGISMDRRIIGSTLANKDVEDERFSKEEFPKDWVENPTTFSFYPQNSLPNLFNGQPSPSLHDLWTFCQSVIHIVLITELAKNEGKVPADLNPWDHICLGSDYDGLISALKKAPTADHLDSLFGEDMKSTLTAMVAHLNGTQVTLNPIQVPNDIVEKLSISNGRAFLEKHFV
ncbi:hypothetical protein GO755_08425 [Spirosoma sp. HMF4905]|uniref:Membrane dipeptidase (Peptidase family M19) n=1 Tax=Spirosoma arboris TaxID=2682092 RepID=A0A7K1S8B9_9BACT|nr:hypothetical protein [Spirosoma arboris]MVM30055.1 hypothetical protein [Spirosoma arboris]